MRIFAVSDIHIDYQDNHAWVRQLSDTEYQQDVLILAGDLSDRLHLLEECFAWLTSKFLHVCYLPGNHELWTLRSKKPSSLDQWRSIEQLIEQFDNLSTDIFQSHSLSIVPLFSWYDFTFGQPEPELLERWMDFRACKWPDDADEEWVTDYFLAQNIERLDHKDETIISFSHFLPRIDLMPSLIPKKHRLIYPVLGTWKLDEQIRKLGSSIHVYGHSHVNRDRVVDGVRYINNAFGYPNETRIAAKKLKCIFEAP